MKFLWILGPVLEGKIKLQTVDVLLDKALVSHCGEGGQILARFLGKLIKPNFLNGHNYCVFILTGIRVY